MFKNLIETKSESNRAYIDEIRGLFTEKKYTEAFQRCVGEDYQSRDYVVAMQDVIGDLENINSPIDGFNTVFDYAAMNCDPALLSFCISKGAVASYNTMVNAVCSDHLNSYGGAQSLEIIFENVAGKLSDENLDDLRNACEEQMASQGLDEKSNLGKFYHEKFMPYCVNKSASLEDHFALLRVSNHQHQYQQSHHKGDRDLQAGKRQYDRDRRQASRDYNLSLRRQMDVDSDVEVSIGENEVQTETVEGISRVAANLLKPVLRSNLI